MLTIVWRMFDKLVYFLSEVGCWTYKIFMAHKAWSNGHQSNMETMIFFGESRAINCMMYQGNQELFFSFVKRMTLWEGSLINFSLFHIIQYSKDTIADPYLLDSVGQKKVTGVVKAPKMHWNKLLYFKKLWLYAALFTEAPKTRYGLYSMDYHAPIFADMHWCASSSEKNNNFLPKILWIWPINFLLLRMDEIKGMNNNNFFWH